MLRAAILALLAVAVVAELPDVVILADGSLSGNYTTDVLSRDFYFTPAQADFDAHASYIFKVTNMEGPVGNSYTIALKYSGPNGNYASRIAVSDVTKEGHTYTVTGNAAGATDFGHAYLTLDPRCYRDFCVNKPAAGQSVFFRVTSVSASPNYITYAVSLTKWTPQLFANADIGTGGADGSKLVTGTGFGYGVWYQYPIRPNAVKSFAIQAKVTQTTPAAPTSDYSLQSACMFDSAALKEDDRIKFSTTGGKAVVEPRTCATNASCEIEGGTTYYIEVRVESRPVASAWSITLKLVAASSSVQTSALIVGLAIVFNFVAKRF